MKAYWGGGTAPHILDLGTRRRWVFEVCVCCKRVVK